MKNKTQNTGTIVPNSSPNGGLNAFELIDKIKERIKIIKAKQEVLK